MCIQSLIFKLNFQTRSSLHSQDQEPCPMHVLSMILWLTFFHTDILHKRSCPLKIPEVAAERGASSFFCSLNIRKYLFPFIPERLGNNYKSKIISRR